jgi:hypothetical protein
MAAEGPRGGDEEREWRDRDTEPIPRARSEPPRSEPSARADDGVDRSGPDDAVSSGSHRADEPRRPDEVGHPDEGPYPDDPPYADDPAHPADSAYPDDDSRYLDDPRYPDDARFPDDAAAFSDQATHDHGRLHDEFPDARDKFADQRRESGRHKPRPYPDDPGPYPDERGGFHGESGGFPDEFPDDFAEGPPGRYAGSSTVGASFVVGEPITEEELGGLRGGATPLVTSRRVVPLEDEPSRLVQRYLFPTEKFRGEWRRHPIELAKEAGIAAGATIVMGLLAGYLVQANASDQITTFLVLGWFAVLVWVAWQIGDWWYDRFILTNKRVMVVSGIITRNVAMMPLQRVTDMKYVQSALGRMLNYGTFELESAGQDQALRSIPHLPSPNELYLRIVEEMYEPEAVEARLAGAQDVIDDGT